MKKKTSHSLLFCTDTQISKKKTNTHIIVKIITAQELVVVVVKQDVDDALYIALQ